MKKLLYTIAVTTIMLGACTGKAADKKAAEALEAADILRIDSITAEIDSIKNIIDSSAKEVDVLVNDL